jgi:hypothetical protein
MVTMTSWILFAILLLNSLFSFAVGYILCREINDLKRKNLQAILSKDIYNLTIVAVENVLKAFKIALLQEVNATQNEIMQATEEAMQQVRKAEEGAVDKEKEESDDEGGLPFEKKKKTYLN